MLIEEEEKDMSASLGIFGEFRERLHTYTRLSLVSWGLVG